MIEIFLIDLMGFPTSKIYNKNSGLKPSPVFFLGLGYCLLGLLFMAPESFAQTNKLNLRGGDIRAVRGITQVPIPEVGSSNEILLINRENVSHYHELLLAPLATWIKDGWFEIRALSSTEYPWSYGVGWERSSREEFNFGLSPKGDLEFSVPENSFRGFPFGKVQMLDREKDPSLKAKKILWNLTSTGLVVRDMLYGFQLTWLSYKSRLRTASALYFRETGLPLVQGIGENQNSLLQQEFFTILTPPVIFGYTQVLKRFLDSREDEVWHYSPVIGRGRRLLAANRSDSLLGSALAMNDFFVWSGKVQDVKARVVSEKELLLPVASLSTYNTSKEKMSVSGEVLLKPLALGAVVFDRNTPPEYEQVITARGELENKGADPSFVKWNFQTKKNARAASWMPESLVFIPRPVWILELIPRDPYSRVGREILVVDKQSMLPIYKISYDHEGEYLKTTVGIWSFALAKKGKLRIPVLSALLVVDGRTRNAVVLETEYARTFRGKRTKAAIGVKKLLDPANIAKIHTPVEEPKKKTKKRRKKKKAPTKKPLDLKLPKAVQPEPKKPL